MGEARRQRKYRQANGLPDRTEEAAVEKAEAEKLFAAYLAQERARAGLGEPPAQPLSYEEWAEVDSMMRVEMAARG